MQFNKVALIVFVSIIAALHAFSQQDERPWLDTNLPIADRAALLVEELTLEEKIAQLVYNSPAIPRLDIPEYNWWNECLHGVARNGKATVFPQAIGLGATFDDELIFRVATAISDEARAKYNVAVRQGNRSQYAGLTFWSPNVNIFRDPRWGRGQETFGEDPYLTSRIGVAFVNGLQGDNPKYLKAAACAKHYVVHSGPEALRHEFNAKVSQKDLFETYMPAFKALVTEAKVEGVMGAYNRTNDFACCASPYLLTDVLKKEWGFDGYIVSDCWAIEDIYANHKLVETPEEAAALAIKAGLQLNCGVTFNSLGKAVKKGLITEEEIDNALIQLQKTRFRLGLFDPAQDNPYNAISPEVVGSEKHVQLALEAAQKSVVMVKNNDVLPLDKNIRNLYVVGPQAANADVLLGNYYGLSENTVNILDGIVSKVSIGTTINYKYGQMPYEANSNPIDWTTGEAKSSDACIAVLGINGLWEGEEGESLKSTTKGDHVEIGLPKPQLEFLKLLRKDNKKPLIVVLTGGFPMSIPEVYEIADAVVYCWYPGQQGGQAVADILFGDVSPSGRMPFTVPLDVEKLPAYDDYNMTGRTYRYMDGNVLFPFGFGIGYSKISYSNLVVAKKNVDADQNVMLSVELKNEGKYDTEEVVQAYITQPGDNNPNYKLACFKRVPLAAGENKKVEIEIKNSELAQFNQDGQAQVKSGTYKLYVGGSSPLKSVATPKTGKLIQSTTFSVN